MKRITRPLSFIIILIILLLGINPTITFSETGLIGYWRLNDNYTGSTVYDSSGYANNGTRSNATWIEGKNGSALYFNGSTSYVSVPSKSNLNFTSSQSFSLSGWIYIPSLQNRWQGVITKGSFAESYEWYGIWINPENKWVFGANGNNVTGTTARTGWSHVAIVQDGSNGKRYLYVNGSLVASGYSSGGVSGSPLWFGGCKGTSEYFYGRIDEVSLRNYALTSSSVYNEYRRYQNRMIGHWRFNEDTGINTYDSSGNGNTGTFQDILSWGVGKYGSCLDIYSGNGRVNVPSKDSFNLSKSDNYTITSWIYISFLSNRWQGVITKGRSTGQWYGLWITGDNKWCYGADHQNIVGTNVTTGWHHLALVQNGYSRTRTLYVDGVNVGSGTSGESLTNDGITFGNCSGVNEQFTGKIDEVAFYNYKFNDSDVLYDYNSFKDRFDYSLNIPKYTQQPYDNLCWATSAAMVISYYYNDTTNRNVSIAKDKYGTTDFNKRAKPSDVVAAVKDYCYHSAFETDGSLTSTQVMDWIGGKDPIVASIEWASGGRHSITMRGYTQGTGYKNVIVNDPGDGETHVYSYDYFVSNSSFKWVYSLRFF